ncbi:MAG: two-component sensor histidine kinase [Butyrivibrio sp.]|nr:two-component sensor histidine kinase [Butyrivibrio sp.]
MKQKINIRLSIIALVAVVTTTIGITIVYYNLFQTQVKGDLRQNAFLLVESGAFDATAYKKIESEYKSYNYRTDSLRITWIDSDGTVLFDNDTDASHLSNHLQRPEIQQALKDGEGYSQRHSDTMNMDTYYYALLLNDGTILRVSTMARTILSILFTTVPVIIFIVVIILLGCVVIGHLLTMQLMKPLEKMAENLDNPNFVEYKELEPFVNKIRSQHEDILAAAKSRQDFTANVSHELKTPITAISGYAEIIENRLYDQESEVHIAKQIRHNADRLLSIVNDIIKLSELDHFETACTFETVDLYTIAEECVFDLKALSEKKHITLTCNGDTTFVNGDKALIREMIENLVQNAIRYNNEYGEVNVSVSNKKGHSIIKVKDTGIGIPSDQLGRIFERFYRVDKSRSRETGGTGLGLAIVKHIVEIHSAKIDISSTIGEGTEILVSF